jgi:hypothetical protein
MMYYDTTPSYRPTILTHITSTQMHVLDDNDPDDLLERAKVEAARYRGWKRLGCLARAEEHRRKARDLVCAVPREPKHLGAHERILAELRK